MEFFLTKYQQEKYWYILNNARNEFNLIRAFDSFRENELEPIAIKGWAAARNFPNFERQFIDIDLCVAPEDFERAKQILETPEDQKLQVDLHKGLRHLDTVPWEDLFVNSRIVQINNTDIRILRPEDHLRVLCVHWLTDGGAYKERLWDIYWAIENRPEDFDWDRFLNVVSVKRRKWLLCCLGLCKKYLGLNLENTPVADEVEEIPQWIIKTVESEWADEVKLKPLQSCRHDRKILWQQIKKRIPPNPIQATIDLEGAFDNTPRIFYQIGDIFKRLYISVKKYGPFLYLINDRK